RPRASAPAARSSPTLAGRSTAPAAPPSASPGSGRAPPRRPAAPGRTTAPGRRPPPASRATWDCSSGSPIDLPEHDVDAADRRDDVRDELALHHDGKCLQVHERGRAHLHPPGPRRAVGHEVEAELALRRLDRAVRLAGRREEAVRDDLEMVDE